MGNCLFCIASPQCPKIPYWLACWDICIEYPTKITGLTCLNLSHYFSGPTGSSFIFLSWGMVPSIHSVAHVRSWVLAYNPTPLPVIRHQILKVLPLLHPWSLSCPSQPHLSSRLSSFHLPSTVIFLQHSFNQITHLIKILLRVPIASKQKSNPRV